MRYVRTAAIAAGLLAAVLALPGCGQEAAQDGEPGAGRGGSGRGGFGGPPGGGRPAAAVPVEVAPVQRRSIAAFIETNGTLEAENEVDIVARVSAPIVELGVEEGDRVTRGQVLARLDEIELQAQVEIARVAVEETRQNFERARTLYQQKLMSGEEYERANAAYEGARAQKETSDIRLGYAVIRAPFAGLIVARYIDAAQQVAVNQPLFRLSDFDPLLCPIQVPERDLARLRIGQPARIEVESWPGERFPARVLRISPVVDAATGTIKVTLEATSPQRLRPGMFARVFLEAEHKDDALVIPKAALSLESIGDTVYVAAGDTASRREVELGFQEGNFVEIVSGVAAEEMVIVVGQDGLSDGTPIQVQGPPGENPGTVVAGAPAPAPGETPAPRGEGVRAGGMDPSRMTPEQLEQLKERMRQRGMTDEQIEERLRRARERAGQGAE